MAKSANKTTETDADVAAFVAAVADPGQRADAEKLIALMSAATGEPPKMWGPSIIGFDSYHYRYDSGREGDSSRIGFSPRKGNTVLYIVDGFPGHAELMSRLGKHKTGKVCLYVKTLADIDQGVLRELVHASLAEMDRRYPKDLAP
jgi:hypothetical protein